MVLDDEVTVESVTREIIEKLNMKMMKDLALIESNLEPKTCELIHSINGREDCFEIYQANKDGKPKGCSFYRNQILRNIKCKSQLCLKVLDCAAVDSIIFKLLDKQQIPIKKYDLNVSPIQEQDDDLISIAKEIFHYKNSIIQQAMDQPSKTPLQLLKQPLLTSQIQEVQQQDENNPLKENVNIFPKRRNYRYGIESLIVELFANEQYLKISYTKERVE